MRWIGLLVVGCAGTTLTSPNATEERTDEGSTRFTYEDVGVACLGSDEGDATSIAVDFGDCLFCSTEVELACEATVDGDRIEVSAGGSLLVAATPCTYRSTCEPTMAWCEGPELPPGEYTLAYAGEEVLLTLPAEDPVCTGSSAAM